MPQKLYDLVQAYGRSKFLITPAFAKEQGPMKQKKVLDIGTLDDHVLKNIHNDLH